ncbi:unnamed protein product [Peronospora effusa]|nr:unnamed protein product [Peronospora effusa]
MGLTMMTASKEMAFNLCGGLLLLAVVYLMISHVSLSERLTAFVLITRCFGAAIASSLTVAVLLSLYVPLPEHLRGYHVHLDGTICLQFGLISSYILAAWIFFPLVGQVLCQLLQRSCLLSSGMYICISLSAMVIPVIHTMCCFAIALIFFIPLLGRSGPVVPLDVVLSLLIMVSYSARVFCFLPAKQLKLIQNICIVITVVSTAYASI